jgi:hypothetical protein
MANEVLLSKVPVPADRVHRIRGEEPDTRKAAEEYEGVLRSFFRPKPGEIPELDFILLGMGADGHTASLFPGTDALEERNRLVAANWVPRLNAHRLTMTLPLLNNAKSVLFLVAGEEKAETLRKVLEEKTNEAFPAGLIRPADEIAMLGRRHMALYGTTRDHLANVALAIRAHGCQFPGCTHDRFLAAHHVLHWLHGGDTKLENLVNLCPHHHRLVHEGGWLIERHKHGDWRFIAPTGKQVDACPATKEWRGDVLAWLQEWADERGVSLGPDSNEPLSDGTRPDYDVAVAGLLG